MIHLWVVIGMLGCSCAQILLKKSAKKEHKGIIDTMLNWQVILAYTIFFGSMLINIYAMSKGLNLKELPVLEASSYIFVPILSWLFLKEKIGWRESGAMALIFLGIMVFYIPQ